VNLIPGYAVVFFGAGIGGCFRHAVNRLFGVSGSSFPWATFTVNCTGSLIMGLLAGWFAFRVGDAHAVHLPITGTSGQHFRLFLTTGVLGGYTTFSAFSLDAMGKRPNLEHGFLRGQFGSDFDCCPVRRSGYNAAMTPARTKNAVVKPRHAKRRARDSNPEGLLSRQFSRLVQ
jgi:fluoride exporter